MSIRSVVLSSLPGESTHHLLQQFMQQLGMLMTSWQATTFLIGEYASDIDANPVFTVADGLIGLRQSIQRNSMVRKIEIIKMRGQAPVPGLHPFRISGPGIEVYAPDAPTADEVAGAATIDALRLAMGVPRLDEMLGGGLPRGYSLLIAGPSGSGKTILSVAFLAEGARLGEHGVIAAFESHPNRLRNSTVATLIAQGSVSLIDNSLPDGSIDEMVVRISARCGA